LWSIGFSEIIEKYRSLLRQQVESNDPPASILPMFFRTIALLFLLVSTAIITVAQGSVAQNAPIPKVAVT
jgi:hypothetical protein